eukprot:GHVP01015398.1.p1 GENE.GHVP01015398.1~~GHVP01015398.1.p1  ORF type:complete len:167 (-),score=32.27 GHVP01015398.1:34-534(-)
MPFTVEEGVKCIKLSDEVFIPTFQEIPKHNDYTFHRGALSSATEWTVPSKKLPGECPGTLLYLKWLKRKQNIHLAKIHLTKVTIILQIKLEVRLFKVSEDTNSVFTQLFGYSANDEESKSRRAEFPYAQENIPKSKLLSWIPYYANFPNHPRPQHHQIEREERKRK